MTVLLLWQRTNRAKESKINFQDSVVYGPEEFGQLPCSVTLAWGQGAGAVNIWHWFSSWCEDLDENSSSFLGEDHRGGTRHASGGDRGRGSHGEHGLPARAGAVLHHLLKLLCFLLFQGTGFYQNHRCHWSRSSEVRTLSVASLLWNLLTKAGGSLWLDWERRATCPTPQEPFLWPSFCQSQSRVSPEPKRLSLITCWTTTVLMILSGLKSH